MSWKDDFLADAIIQALLGESDMTEQIETCSKKVRGKSQRSLDLIEAMYAADPSGMFMSAEDLPKRLSDYGGDHIMLKRIALTGEHVNGLPSFPAADKRTDPRYKWFRSNYGDRCWELDAMDPNNLRDCVQQAIVELIEPVAWDRCETVNQAEQE